MLRQLDNIGLNVAGDGHESPADIAATGTKWIRVVAVQGQDIRGWLESCKALGLKVLMVYARESMNGDDWRGSISEWNSHYGDLVDYHQCGNEPDSDPNAASSWHMSSKDVTKLLREGRRALGDSAFIVGPGLCSGVASLADPIDWSPVNAIALQPYGTLPDRVNNWSDVPGGFNFFPELVETYRHIGKPIWVTEIGTDGFYASEDTQARYLRGVVPVIASLTDGPVFWFNMSDWKSPNYGILRDDGTKKPSYFAFQEVAGAPVTITPQVPKYVLGFKDAHDANPDLVGDPIENEWGAARGISLQRTSNGVLIWANTVASGSVLSFLDTRDGNRYRWDGTTLQIA